VEKTLDKEKKICYDIKVAVEKKKTLGKEKSS